MSFFMKFFNRIGLFVQKIGRTLSSRPFFSFLFSLLILVGVIVLANYLRNNNGNGEEKEVQAKTVQTFVVGDNIPITLSGKVENSGVLTISAQGQGILSTIHVTEGKKVNRGTRLFSIGSSYSGSSMASLSSQLAKASYTFNQDTYNTQKDIIGKRRDIAEKSFAQAEDLRRITRDSIGDTEELIRTNENQLNGVNATLEALRAANQNGTNDDLISQAEQGRVQLLSALSQLRNGLRNAQYQGSDDQESAKLAENTRDLTLKQLDIESRSLELTQETSRLNLRLAQVSEELQNPVSPCNGVVERVFVSRYQAIMPGTPLMQISCTNGTTKIVAQTGSSVAKRLQLIDSARALSTNEEIPLRWTSTSSQPGTNGSFSIVFVSEKGPTLDNGSYIDIVITPVIESDSTSIIPLDSLYNTEEGSYVYVLDTGNGNQTIARAKKVVSKNMFGSYVVVEGIERGDQIILDRTVIDGEKVRLHD